MHIASLRASFLSKYLDSIFRFTIDQVIFPQSPTFHYEKAHEERHENTDEGHGAKEPILIVTSYRERELEL